LGYVNLGASGALIRLKIPLRRVAVRLFPRIILAGWGRDMSEDSKRWPAAKPNASEGRGDPQIWSPWNFQFPNSNRLRKPVSFASTSVPPRDPNDNDDEEEEDNSGEADEDREPAVIREPDEDE
jgi:hypothetical protein